jgi:hypothetical protein
MATRNPSLNIVPSLKRNQTEFELAAADAELMGARGDWWWTGLKPTACPGFDEEAGVLRWVQEQVQEGLHSTRACVSNGVWQANLKLPWCLCGASRELSAAGTSVESS